MDTEHLPECDRADDETSPYPAAYCEACVEDALAGRLPEWRAR